MIDPDKLNAGRVQKHLHSKDFILVKNDKSSHDLWANDISLIGRINDDQSQHIFIGWAACNHCMMAYRTHSKPDSDGNRKNNGLNSIHHHIKECKSRLAKSTSTTNGVTKWPVQTTLTRFTYHKNKLSDNLTEKLKDAELKFVVAGAHSFNLLENGGIIDLVQTAIEIGSQIGNVDVSEVFYGRKTIRSEAFSKFDAFRTYVRALLDEPIKQHCVAATCDLWSDDLVKRSYLDFTVFWIDEKNQLQHCLLRCKHFEEESKTAMNIWTEIREIFESFHLSFGDTPVVTDQGANMVAAFKVTAEARFSCMAHRCSTMPVVSNLKVEFKYSSIDS